MFGSRINFRPSLILVGFGTLLQKPPQKAEAASEFNDLAVEPCRWRCMWWPWPLGGPTSLGSAVASRKFGPTSCLASIFSGSGFEGKYLPVFPSQNQCPFRIRSGYTVRSAFHRLLETYFLWILARKEYGYQASRSRSGAGSNSTRSPTLTVLLVFPSMFMCCFSHLPVVNKFLRVRRSQLIKTDQS